LKRRHSLVIRAPRQPDPGVEERVHDVDQQVDQHVPDDRDQHDGLDDGVVPGQHRVHGQLAEPGDHEDLLGHHRAADQRAELEAEHRDHGRQAVAQRVRAHDLDLGQALRPGGPDVVGRQRPEHRRAGLPHEDGGEAGAEHEGGQDHALEVLAGVLGEGDVPGGGQEPPGDREQQDAEQAEPEVRHRQPGQAEPRGQVVGEPAAPDGRDDARAHADDDRDQHGQG
jgi:hypothetical protein